MTAITPPKLKSGDTIEIIAPSQSMGIISKDLRQIANKRFEELGFHLIFAKHIEEKDEFNSSPITFRVDDLLGSFQNPKAAGVLSTIGGFNANQLLHYIDWQVIRNNPKIFCGYSDITALQNAIYAKTGLITYSGPHYSTFGQKLYFDYSLEYWKKCCMATESFEIKPSDSWTDDDAWWSDQEDRHPMPNPGWLIISEGEAQGTILGGNLCTFNLLQGTEYMPDLAGSILFFEDDAESAPHHFDRDLQSVIHQPGFSEVKGLVIGRFQKASHMSDEKLKAIIKSKKELEKIPVMANVDFGHTDPKITFPIGGTVQLVVSSQNSKLEILNH